MLCINNIYTDAYFNIAAEEYLLKNLQDNIFMLYRNEPSVIIGKHQNVRSEINTEFAKKHQVKIVRRFSGGGAVYHDLGNLNLTFIENGYNLNFDKFTNQMIDMLSLLGIQAKTDERRALTVDGLKISGSAQCVHKNRVMYHATLLFSSDLANLQTSLEGDSLFVPDNKVYVKSVKSPVTNVVEHLNHSINMDYIQSFVMNYFMNKDIGTELYKFTREDMQGINELRNNKYSTQEWNYDAYILNSNRKNKAVVSSPS